MNSIHTFESYTKNLKSGSEVMNKTTTAINGKMIDETHVKWVQNYPLLECFDYEAKHKNENNQIIWEYNYESSQDGFKIDIVLEIKRITNNWSIDFNFESDYNGKEQSNKNVSKQGLTGSKMNAELKKIMLYLEGFNRAFKSKNDFLLIKK